MTFKHQYFLVCDHPGCASTVRIIATDEKEANLCASTEHGWSAVPVIDETSNATTGYKHFCPQQMRTKTDG